MTFRGKVLLAVIAAFAVVGLLHVLGMPGGERLVINASNNLIIHIGAHSRN